MVKNQIYYFSGTGNSYVTAKKIAAKTDSQLINIATVVDKDTIYNDGDIVGIVFPIYYVELPLIVDKFISFLNIKKDAYIYTVATFGGGKGGSLKRILQILKSKGVELSAFYGMQMPQNAFDKPFDNYETCYKNSNKMINQICNNISTGKKGVFYSSKVVNALQVALYPLLKNVVNKELPKKIGLDNTTPLSKTIQNLDQLIKVNDNCNHCGVCVSVCPVKNIEISGGNPVWKHNCENCLACYNFCPQKAIKFGVVDMGFRYLHPEYKLKDAIDNNNF